MDPKCRRVLSQPSITSYATNPEQYVPDGDLGVLTISNHQGVLGDNNTDKLDTGQLNYELSEQFNINREAIILHDSDADHSKKGTVHTEVVSAIDWTRKDP